MKEESNLKIETNDKAEPDSKRGNKFFTKDKICFFVIGLLLGAVIASGAFLIYNNINQSNQSATMPGNGTPPNMSNGGTPPELPNGETPPELPDGEMPGTPPEASGEDDQSNSNNSNNSSNSNSSSNSSSSNSSKSRPQRPSEKLSNTNETN